MSLVQRYMSVFVLGVFTFTLSQNAFAQDVDELMEENQELMDEIEELNETIVNLEEQIAELEAMIESLTEDEEAVEADNDADESDRYGIGDEFEVNGVTLRVEDAYYTDQRNEFVDISPDQVLMIEIFYENNSGEDYSPAFDFNVYYDGTLADTHPVGDIILDNVSDGRNSSGTLAFEIMGEPETIELEYSQLLDLFSDSESIIVDVTPE
ncbi:DUF4352 domain-containing protein [Aliicoccus persicus]|uniref:DUF4352 domain-containing protein n=1 Tax=Aliicoccus persicus TaxID=930138 RepID=A0A662Z099_9STAP|nr:DUF4352 domain-containing protein [Aliicoccus persicus]SEV79860.1 protein of unknown function [Aliicoccus persicus]